MDAQRTATLKRHTTETKIDLTLVIDGQGTYNVTTGIRFFDHMLELFTRHGAFDLTLTCAGDLDVDQHHTVEDTGIALGEAFAEALGEKRGILRAGYFVMAMDETLAVAAIDLSGRTAYVVDDQVTVPVVGDFQTELLADFFDGFARGARANVHVKTMVRPQQPPQDRSDLQSLCARPPRRLFHRRTHARPPPLNQGPPLNVCADPRN